MCLLTSAGLHALVLALLWGVNIVPPTPIRVILVAPPRAPGESAAPRGDQVATGPRRGEPAPKRTGELPEPGATPGATPEPVPVAEPVPEPAAEPVPEPAVVLLRPRLASKLQLDLPDLEPGGAGDGGVPTEGPRAAGDASAYGPGDARLSLLLRADRIRGTRYVDDVRQALAPFPDDRMLRERVGLDPLTEFDSILIATANPFDFNATFLAARYSFAEGRLRQGFARAAARERRTLAWRTQAGRPVASLPILGPDGKTADPRVLLLVRRGVAVLTRPEHVDAIAAATVADGGVPRPAAGDWPGRLSLLEAETGGDPDGPALLLTLHEVRSYVWAAPGETLPIPHTGRLTIGNLRTEPNASFDLGFDSPAQAASFVQQWTPRARQLAGSTVIFLMGLSDLATRFQVQARGSAVHAHAVVHPAELQQILRLIAQIGPAQPAAASQPAGTSQPASAATATQPASSPASQPTRSGREPRP